jgi:hypothetical protein
MELKRIGVGVGTALVGGVLAASALTSSAEAAQVHRWQYGPSKHPAVVAIYDDGSNELCIWDTKSDGHSVLAKWHFVGAPTHQLWDHAGNGEYACHSFKRSNENKTIEFKICTGEFAKAAANRRVIGCGAQHSFWI